ncbi:MULTISPECIES: EamA family transporter RarD [Cupriavidus]|uniref:Predicted permease rarD n=1 Tax=Cupriavidus taiwanensis TaxID=164546 RepID=A0A375E2G6_9BURK|nr:MULTISPECIES: EamA family transporter RarD [Cupriavidus]RAS04918.1 chloramphenicol-sensitive protein RarD [Cupriavidus alkaliphilus]SOZ58593.1 putative predicted permease rarD [Cupriavidus taiwanensis]SOZ59614.1 putative predicted permease rarD [Cupriavidus taiwanensis]SOZ62722.1 putative predicted permease rarD [Cupriavidus taiwanensis]SPA06319.1 putative predicted permease rarD [Cupriavidus taiwanensis]
MQLGILYALLAYLIWGLLPLYIKSLPGIAPTEILLHRMVWSLVFLGLILAWRRQWAWLGQVVRDRRLLLSFAASAALLCANWFLYIWAVSANRVVDASLGYFINPLFSVLLGVVFLHERLRRVQWLAIAVAAAGVAWLTVAAGQLPWIALGLAASFGGYGLLRKTGALGALEGLSLETLLLFPLAAAALGWLFATGQDSFTHAAPGTQWLLLLAGPVTAVPLLFFAAGARRIPLSLLGLLQYTGPTLQLLLGVWLWHEPFPAQKQVGYALIWLSLALYAAEGLWMNARQKPAGIQSINETT